MEINEERLDKIILQRGLIASRGLTEKIIQETGVLVNGKLIRKPGKKFPIDVKIELSELESEYISKNSLKLLKAKDFFKLDFKDKVVLDVCSEIGSFSEVAIEFGAKQVYNLNDKQNVLHPKLKVKSNLISLENIDVRELNSNLVPELIDICLIDVEDISLELVFPFIHLLLDENAKVLAVLKPQNELAKLDLTKNGLVKRKAEYPKVIQKITAEAKIANLKFVKRSESPILGKNSNLEFLLLFEKS